MASTAMDTLESVFVFALYTYATLLLLSVILCVWGWAGLAVDVFRYGRRAKP